MLLKLSSPMLKCMTVKDNVAYTHSPHVADLCLGFKV
jgi:hypothetical protein